MDTRKIRELNERLCNITRTLTEAKRLKDETGEVALSYHTYKKLCDERKSIRSEIEKISCSAKAE